MRACLVALLLCATAGVADAQEENIDCNNQMSQMEMNICAGRDYEEADKELNAVWKDAKASAKEMDAEFEQEWKGAEAALLAAQRGWIAYRDGNCELAGWEAHRGSMEPMLVSGCLATMTRQRTKELKAFIAGEPLGEEPAQ